MKKVMQIALVVTLVGTLLSSCRSKTVCLECTITIAGIEEDKGKTCDDIDTINALEADYQEIVDRENTLVGQSAFLDCIKYIEP